MKQVLRTIGVILVVLGIVVAVVGRGQAKEAQGASVTVGYVQNGEFTATRSGTIGQNKQKETDMKSLSWLGYVAAAVGVGMIVMAPKFDEEY